MKRRTFLGLLGLLGCKDEFQDMKINKKLWWMGGASTPAINYDLLRFALKYRTTDYASYLTTTSYSDKPTLSTDQGVIKVETMAIDGSGFSNSITTPVFIAAEDVDDSQIMARDGVAPNAKIWDLDWTTLTDSIGSNQSIFYDPLNDLIGTFGNPGILWYNRSGVLIETLTTPTISGSTSTKIFFDYTTGLYYVSPSNSPLNILVWERSGTTLTLKETTGIDSAEGVALDFARGLLISFNNDRIDARQQSLSGIKNISIKPGVVTNTEGVAVFPDGTLLLADPAAFHFSVVGGNRLWWTDPFKLYKKYERSPAMTRFSKFTGGTLSGQIEGQKITQAVGGKIYSPVYDTDGFTNTENADAWEFEFSDDGDADITFVCSDTAPTTTPTTNYFSDIPVYAGWGDTVPDAEAGIPGTKRYKQAVLTVKVSTSSVITVEQILETLGSKCKIFTYDGDRSRTYATPTLSDNALELVNLANPKNNLIQTTNTLRFAYSNADAWMQDSGNNNNYKLQDISVLSGDTEGQVINVVRGVSSSATRVWFGLANSSSNNNRLYALHFGTPNFNQMFERVNGSGSISQQVIYNDSDLVFKRWDFICDGSDWIIKRNNIEVARTVGANEWFAACTGVTEFAIGLCEGATTKTGTHLQRLFIYCSSPLSTEENQLIQDFIVQEGLI